MNFTNTETPKVDFDCSDEDLKFYISLAVNVGLLFITGISELMGASKCKSNGFVDGIKKSMSRIVENDIPDLEENMFAN